jgi:hypothetical protein
MSFQRGREREREIRLEEMMISIISGLANIKNYDDDRRNEAGDVI